MPETPVHPLATIPFHFWSAAYFVFGCIFGSLANVCIHRLPRGESIVSPRSHCPHCGYMIPAYLNIPLLTWMYLRGRCANCGTSISFRYLLVELLTGLMFMSCWLTFGNPSQPETFLLATVFCVLLFGFIVATFIDFEHFIIPDEITLGGIAVGFLASCAVPALHHTVARATALKSSFLGILLGAGLVYGILRLGKLLFGRQKIVLAPDSKLVFTETALHLPDSTIPYEDIFYRKSDTIVLHAKRLELVDRCYQDVQMRLSPALLQIGEETFNPEDVHHVEVKTDQAILPREAMGLGDVKFMAAIGAFVGWQGVIFSLMVSAIIGSIVGVTLIALHRREWSSRLPYGPYIAIAATFWVFGGDDLWRNWWAFPHR